MGELFRRFWLPVALSRELPEPDCPPPKGDERGISLGEAFFADSMTHRPCEFQICLAGFSAGSSP
jgi:hypothetical protein